MTKKGKILVAGVSAVILLILIIVLVIVIRANTPSKEVMPLEEYFTVQEGEAQIIFNDGYYDKKALYLDGQVYVDYETVKEKFNHRFYWDSNENLLLYTTSVSIIKAGVGKEFYHVNKSKSKVDYQIVKTQGDEVYIALDYVALFSNIKYRFFEGPSRVRIDYEWDSDYLYSTVTEDTQVRFEADIKSKILEQVKIGDKLQYIDSSEVIDEKFVKVMTEDGVIGYVRNKYISAGEYEKLTSDYKEEEYSHITKDYKINMVFHQIWDPVANDDLLNLLDSTKGVTTVCPTWFTLADEEGNINSNASETYVERAHNAGVEVWALVSDVEIPVDIAKLLTFTSKREKLINELLAQAIKLNLDGLNIDFEQIPSANGEDYIQFLRELSVKCRNNGIILSVDNYVPTEYTAYYNREEQGKVVDYVVVMAYDEHYAGSEEAGSVSSITFVKDGIANTLKEVPKEQVIVAIPFYTRIWAIETKSGGTTEMTPSAYGMSNAMNFVKDHEGEKTWDETTQQYYSEFEGTNDEGKDVLFKVWLEEEKSIEAKMKAIDEADVAGVAEWKLGIEDESVWDIIIKYVN